MEKSNEKQTGKNMTALEKLLFVQSGTLVLKNKTNDFGKYKYRNVEEIYSVVKPLLKEVGAVIRVTAEPVEICGSVYMKATADFTDCETGESAHISEGWAEIAGVAKGKSPEQITGTAATYAIKYAVSSLLLVEGESDPDEYTDFFKDSNTGSTRRTKKSVSGKAKNENISVEISQKNSEKLTDSKELSDLNKIASETWNECRKLMPLYGINTKEERTNLLNSICGSYQAFVELVKNTGKENVVAIIGEYLAKNYESVA